MPVISDGLSVGDGVKCKQGNILLFGVASSGEMGI